MFKRKKVGGGGGGKQKKEIKQIRETMCMQYTTIPLTVCLHEKEEKLRNGVVRCSSGGTDHSYGGEES